MSDKQTYKIVVLIPYRKVGKDFLVYLQKRDENAPTFPGFFGFFGGHTEGAETNEEALVREIKEELAYFPAEYKYLGMYSHESVPGQEKFVYYSEAEDDFENKITVLEGEYGKWFTEAEISEEPKLGERNKIIVSDLIKKLRA